MRTVWNSGSAGPGESESVMIVKIYPSEIKGHIDAPPSKSALHRLMICAALAGGTSTISNVSDSQDILATSDCLRALGACIHDDSDRKIITGIDMTTVGKASPVLDRTANTKEEIVMECRESGSTLRFMIPVAAVTAKAAAFRGSSRLMERPLAEYESLFKERGLLFDRSGGALHISGPLSGGVFRLAGDVSSQFVSGLLFALPLLEEDSIIALDKPPVSSPYIEMSLQALETFGVKAGWKDDRTLSVPGRQRYVPKDIRTEGDWSNASYFLAMGAGVRGLDAESLQADKVCSGLLKQLDAGSAELDIRKCPDLGPLLMAYAAMKHGAVLHGTDRLKIKESDRSAVMKEELSKFRTRVEIGDDVVKVYPGAREPAEILRSHNDHRIVMALTVLCSCFGGTIEGAESVSKSFPDFFKKYQLAGGRLEIN